MKTPIKDKHLPMFTTTNDTDQWVVAVDGLHARYETKEAAQAVYNSLGGSDGDDGLGDTPFGSAEILPPNYSRSHHTARITDFTPVNLVDYIAKGYSRQRHSPHPPTTPKERLEFKRFFPWM